MTDFLLQNRRFNGDRLRLPVMAMIVMTALFLSAANGFALDFPAVVDLNTPLNITTIDYIGEATENAIGSATATGDFNGDGKADLVIGAPKANNGKGCVYVVFNGVMNFNEKTRDLATATNVVKILGANPIDNLGYSVAAGDFNGDSYDDIIIGAINGDPSNRINAGMVYIVYGNASIASSATINFGVSLSGITRIFGASQNDNTGYALACGDVDHDGYDDIAIGAPFADYTGRIDAGKIYIVFGFSAYTTVIDLASPATSVARIVGEEANDQIGKILALGDINGDGRSDVAISSTNTSGARGGAYVVMGKTTLRTVGTCDLKNPSLQTVKVYGETPGDRNGSALLVKDLNGDSFAELTIGASGADADSGQVNILGGGPDFGRLGTIVLGPPTFDIFRIYGADAGYKTGSSLAAGDFNDDGFNDLVIGAEGADYQSRLDAGAAYIIWSDRYFLERRILHLKFVPQKTTKIYGDAAGDGFAQSFAVGDFDADGIEDLAAGYSAADPAGRTNAGRILAIKGYSSTTLLHPSPAGGSYVLGSTNISMFFSSDLNDLTVGVTDLFSGAVNGNLVWSGSKAVFTPYQPIPAGRTIRVTVSGHNSEGTPISYPSWDFGVKENSLPPRILSKSPENAEQNVSNHAVMSIGFSSDVAPDSTTVTITGLSGRPIAKTTAWTDSTLKVTLAPGDSLFFNEQITVSVYTADSYGDHATYQWNFTVRPESVPPYFTVNNPVNVNYLSKNGTIELVFPHDIDKTNITTIFESNAGKTISGVWKWTDNYYRFQPSVDYSPLDIINLTVTAVDIHKNVYIKTITFTVRGDEIPPSILSRTPDNGDINTVLSPIIMIEFTNDVVRDSTTVTITSGKQGAKVINKVWNDYHVTVTLDSQLLVNDVVTVTVNAEDMYTNKAQYSWSFTTRPETNPPYFTVRLSSPPNLLNVNETISLVFPGDVDKGTVVADLKGSQDDTIAGSWSWADSVYTFYPAQPYTKGYTLKLTVTASDIHKNSISDTRTFTVTPDTTPPTIKSRYPAANQVAVPLNSIISLNFSGDVVPDSTTYSVRSFTRGVLTVSPAWNDSSLTLTPIQQLIPNETITVSVSTSDNYANRTVSEWYFSTGATIDLPYYAVKVPFSMSAMRKRDKITLIVSNKVDKQSMRLMLLSSAKGLLNQTWSNTDSSFVFTPADDFIFGDRLTLIVNAKDTFGNQIPEEVYELAVADDETPPVMEELVPAANAANVHPSEPVVIQFSNDVMPDSVSVYMSGSFHGIMQKTLTWDGSRLTVNHTEPFKLSEQVTMMITAADVFGNKMSSTWMFTVRNEIEKPIVALLAPSNPNLLGLTQTISLVFSSDIDQSSVTSSLLDSRGEAIPGSWSWTGYTRSFTPTGYPAGEDLTLTVNGADIHTNELDERVFRFTVKGDEEPPALLSFFPEKNAINVRTDDNIVVQFSEDVVPDSVRVMINGSKQGVLTLDRSWQGSIMTIINNNHFMLNETISVNINAGDIFANRSSFEWSFTVVPDNEPPIIQIVTSSDKNNLAVNALITLSFSSDVEKSTVQTTLTGSQSGALQGEWHWRYSDYTFTPSSNYQVGETIVLTVDAADKYGNHIPKTTETLKVGLHTPRLIIDSVTLADSLTNRYTVTYSVDDADNSMTRTRNYQFAIGNGQWTDFPAGYVADNGAHQPGTWTLSMRLPNNFYGVYSDSVYFRMDVYDGNFNSGFQVSPPFHVDVNELPTVMIVSVQNLNTESMISIAYTIADRESNPVSLAFEYSFDNGLTWRSGVANESLENIPSQDYTGLFHWNYRGLLIDGVDYFGVRVRLTPSDYKTGISAVSGPVRVDLNAPPSLVLDDLFTPQNGKVTLTYQIADAENDTVDVQCYYSIEGGKWIETEHVAGVSGILDYHGAIVWDSKKDIPSIETFNVRFRAIPSDHSLGNGDETAPFQLFNNAPPIVTVSLPDTVGNKVVLSYSYNDIENDSISLHVEWTTDRVVWNPATVIGMTDNLKEKTGAVVWNAFADIGEGMFPGLTLRIYGTDTGNPIASSSLAYDNHLLTVDNEGPRPIAVWGTAAADTVYVRFNETVADSTGNDPRRYSLSHGLTINKLVKEPVSGTIGLILADGQLLPQETLTLTVSHMVDRFGNRTAEKSYAFMPDDDNVNPSVSISITQNTVSGDVTFSYSIADPENDIVSLALSYSTNSGKTWAPATVSGALTGLDPTRYTGTAIWRSAIDLPGLDISGVVIKVVATDSQSGEPGFSRTLRVDNNQPPTIAITVANPDSIFSGDINIAYVFADAEGDTLGMTARFSLDGGATYRPATIFGGALEIGPADYNGSFVWDTGADMPAAFGQALFSVIPHDKDEGAASSILLWIDNYGACRVTATPPQGEQSAAVTLSYVITDVNNRTVSLRAEYSIDNGSSWHTASLSGDLDEIGPDKYYGSFAWNASSQLAGFEGNALLKITPNNGMDGVYTIVTVALDFNEPPTITILPITVEVSDDVSVSFAAIDTEHDRVSIFMEYSINGGANWYETEYGSANVGFPSDGSMQTIVWRSAADLPGKEYSDVRIRLTVSDNDRGTTAGISSVHLDNNRPPTIALTVARPDSIYEDSVDILYSLADAENNMLSFALTYSSDGGKTYHNATVTGKTSAIFSSGYSSSVRWEIAKDLSYAGTVLVKAVPSDNDFGKADSLTVKVNTFGVSMIALSVAPGEHESDVPVSFVISDSKNNVVALDIKYSINNGLTWVVPTVTGNVSDIDPNGYVGSFIWRASQDIAGKDIDCLLMVTPDNGTKGVADTVMVRVDYNQPPSVVSVGNDLTKEYTGLISILFTLADPENDASSVSIEYSCDGGSTFNPAKTSGPLKFTPGKPAQLAWATFDDLGFVYRDTIYLRLTAADNDPGAALLAGPFVITNLVGDFTLDRAIDAADLVKFTTVWKTHDISKETGPVEGAPPALTVIPDGKIDFDDLASFVWMWNWYSAQASARFAQPAFKTAGEEAAVSENAGPLSVAADGKGAIVFSTDRAVDFFDVTVSYADGTPLEAVTAGCDYWSGPSGIILTRTYGGKAFEIAAARLDDVPANSTGPVGLGGIAVGQAKGDIVISWSLRFAGEETVLSGMTVVSRDDVFSRPAAFALHQNTPNPFNPSTTIRFSLPVDCHATLTVLSITGQRVATLTDGALSAGEHVVVWDASSMANGVYFCTIEAGSFMKTMKMTLMK